MRKININGSLHFNEPLYLHTTFRVGGPADIFFQPKTSDEIVPVLKEAVKNTIPVFFVGEGSNILVSDAGIRGLVIDLSTLRSVHVLDSIITAESGAEISRVAEIAADYHLAGMEFIFAMPGTVGGALWMNARCYGTSIADIVEHVEILDNNYCKKTLYPEDMEFGYKSSVFQKQNNVILSAAFRLRSQSSNDEIKAKMARYRRDREKKGHFRFPCAGSIFKNNRNFGAPTGEIIDRLGLRGYTIGGAKISDLHANIIVNTGTASATDILQLIEFIEKRVRTEYGLELEREILLVGEWDKE